MIKKVMYLIFGIASTILGFLVLSDKGFYHRGIFIDCSENYIFISFIHFIVSILFFIAAYREKASCFDEDEILMCPSCVKPFRSDEITEDRCPDCKHDVESLKGFYDRHPEFKE